VSVATSDPTTGLPAGVRAEVRGQSPADLHSFARVMEAVAAACAGPCPWVEGPETAEEEEEEEHEEHGSCPAAQEEAATTWTGSFIALVRK